MEKPPKVKTMSQIHPEEVIIESDNVPADLKLDPKYLESLALALESVHNNKETVWQKIWRLLK